MHKRYTFPFRSTLSLAALIEYWRAAAADPPSPHTEVAAQVVRQLEQAPELEGDLSDASILQRHRGLVDQLMSAIFPPAVAGDTRAAAFAPFSNEAFYATPGYSDLLKLAALADDCDFSCHLHNMDTESFAVGKTVKAYSLILKRIYGVDASFDYPVLFHTSDKETGLEHYYKLEFNPRFAVVRPVGPVRPLSEEDVRRLVSEPMNLALWKELLPPEAFEFSGFVVMTLVDVTDQEVLSVIKNDLLQKDALTSPEKLDDLQRRIRTLLQTPDLHLGLLCLDRNGSKPTMTARAVGRSLLGKDSEVALDLNDAGSSYRKALESRCEPVVVHDLATWPASSRLESSLLDQGYRNLVVTPLQVEGDLIGLMELASPRAGALTALSAIKLTQAVSLFATALKRSLDEAEDRVQAVIKEHFTAIHPAVEWRFREVARTFIRQAGSSPRSLEPIVFNDVYPLYGLTDIRGSSVERNAAVQADLIDQLGLALAVVVEATAYRPMPILDVLGHRLMNGIAALESDLHTEDELTVLEFLQQEIEPLFPQLRTFGESVQKRIAAYQSALDPQLGVLHRRRKAFEESITLINETVSCYIDEQDKLAQSVFPHYFEKYKTDGVDHNIYVGASLLQDGEFDRMYLQNLRVWQLMMMCGVEWKLRSIRPRLKMPLDATHLILVHSTPLSIRFRYDEKRFDADGAYNIRYEIIKKRIDKALIRGTQERLTEPGTIAIVYQHVRDGMEYRRYIEYLQAAGYLGDTVEELELEDLQGMYGLKALRVHVNEHPPMRALHVGPELTNDLRKQKIAVDS